ncbi:MAG TPA: hypothetical protein VFF04_04280 [Candidatus Babeliales bacterium]|nr:hypothetical protein [Candidatus Babeliales bacterium]
MAVYHNLLLVGSLFGSACFLANDHPSFDPSEAIGRLDKHIKILAQFNTTNPTICMTVCSKLNAFFAKVNYETSFKHPLVIDTIKKMCASHRLESIIEAWDIFRSQPQEDEDKELFIEEFSQIIVIVYQSLNAYIIS